MNKSNKIISITTTAILVAIIALGQITSVQAHRLTPAERFDSGYNQGIIDCGHLERIIEYKHSVEYQGHSEDYHHGYFSGSNSCGDDPTMYPREHPELFNNGILQKVNADSGNEYKTSQTVVKTVNPIQNMNNEQPTKVTCIGTCYFPNTQTQISSDKSGDVTSDDSNSGTANAVHKLTNVVTSDNTQPSSDDSYNNNDNSGDKGDNNY